MHWIAPSEKDTDNAALEKRLWDTAEQAVPAHHFAESEPPLRYSKFVLRHFPAPTDARSSPSRACGTNAKQPSIGKTVDDAMVAIERDWQMANAEVRMWN